MSDRPAQPARSRGRLSALCVFAAVALLAVLALPRFAAATHYPDGALCYDCHAVSASKMVVGTHLIKKSQKTVDLGITGGSTAMRCLFCHDENAVSVSRTVMNGVWNHFNSASVSKHDVDVESTGTQNSAAFDCLDCHKDTVVGVGVVSDGQGNANVHGADASAGALQVNTTLLGSPASLSDSELSTKVCALSTCHGGASDNTVGTKTAVKAHSFTSGITLNDGAVPTACTQCHGKHNSTDGTSLLTLLNTSGANGSAATGATVKPEECEVCHNADDGATYATHGHGKTTAASGRPLNLKCTSCHNGAVPHDLGKGTSLNPLRFLLTENTTLQSTLRQKAPYNQAYSVCLTCHAQYANKIHKSESGTVSVAGCNDCHEPHGLGVSKDLGDGAGTITNIMMIRRQIPKVNGSGAAVYGDGTGGSAYEAVVYRSSADQYLSPTYATTALRGQGLCDNAECHKGQTTGTGTALYPLSTLMAGTAHEGGAQTDGTGCTGCHSHTDSGGAWAANVSCSTCHGQPPVGTPTTAEGYTGVAESQSAHKMHRGVYSYACTACHLKNTDATFHNTGNWNPATATWTNSANASYASVFFDLTLNPSANNTLTGTAPKQYAASYNPTTRQCSNLYCHSDGQSSASVNGAGSADWDLQDWGATNLGCNACHGTSTTVNTTAYGAPDHTNGTSGNTANSHTEHSAYACSTCHYDTITDGVATDGWTIASTANHVNGTKDLKADGTTATFTDVRTTSGGTYTCGNISCHNTGSAKWGSTLACSGCHLRTTAAGGDLENWNIHDGIAAAVDSDQWASTGHGRSTAFLSGNSAAGFTGPATDTYGCAYCHSPSVTHGTATNPFRLANKSTLARGATTDGGWNDVCLVCHMTGKSGYDPDGASTGYTSKNGVSKVDSDHYGAKHSGTANGGAFCWDCHDPHGDANHYMIHSGDGSAVGKGVTDRSDGTYGLPTTSRAVTGFDVVTGGYTSDDLANVANTGLCQTCHAAGGAGAKYFYRDNFTPLADHNGANVNRCTTCHTHQTGFGASCDSCHGNSTTGNWWPDSVPTGSGGHGIVYPNRAGDHSQHIAAIAARMGWTTVDEKNTSCSWCHPNPGASGHNNNTVGSTANTADVAMDGYNQTTHFKNILGAANGVATESYNPTTKSCSNVDCHYRVATPSTGTSPAVGWLNPADTAACSTCHGNGAAGAALPNSHPDHVNSGAKAYGCWNCHPSGLSNANYSVAHQGGSVNLDFTNALDPATGGPRTEVYTVGVTPTTTTTVKYGTGTFGTCSATYCHGNFTGGTVANAPTWGTSATGQCGTCHGGNGTLDGTTPDGAATVMSDANHTDHLTATFGPNFGNQGCTGTATTGCHTGSTLATSTHVNGTKDFANVVTTTAASSVLGATGPTGAPDATSTDRCNRCHSNGVAVGQTLSGTVLAKTNWATGTYTLPCLTCHNAAQPATRYADGTGVAAPAKDTYFDSGGHGRATLTGLYPVTGNPAANYTETRCTVCHAESSSHISGVLADTDRLNTVTSQGLTYVGATSDLCLDCHKVGQISAPVGVGHLGKDAANEATVHSGGVTGKFTTSATAPTAFPAYGDSLTSYATNKGYQCEDCHDAHGTKRLAMVLDTLDGKLGGVSNPVTLGANVLLRGTATDLTGLDPTTTADDGVCDVCHKASGTTAPHPDSNHSGDHNQGQSCVTCHAHYQGFKASCTGCHGNTAAGNIWPDGTAENGTGYPNRPGTHDKHITAIAVNRYGATPTTAQKNNLCDACHPGTASTSIPLTLFTPPTPPVGHPGDVSTGANRAELIRLSLDAVAYVGPPTAGDYWSYMGGSTATSGTATAYETLLSGGPKESPITGYYGAADQRCRNVACHGGVGSASPGWNGDFAPPVWASTSGIAGTPTAGASGAVTLSWNAATDAYPSNPVVYDVYMVQAASAPSAATLFATTPIFTNLLGTGVTKTGLTNNVNYYFGVRAKDSPSGAGATVNSTTNTDVSAAVVPADNRNWGTGTSTVYYGRAGAVTGATSDGTQNPTATGTTINPTTGFGRQYLSTTVGASTFSISATPWANNTAYQRMVRFYLTPVQAADLRITGNQTSGTLWRSSTATGDSFQVVFYDYDPAGTLGNGRVLGTSSAIAGSTTSAAGTFTTTIGATTIPAGHMLLAEVQGKPAATGNTLTIAFNNAIATSSFNFTLPVTTTLTADTTPPSWGSNLSGVAASDLGLGDELSVTWTAATEATSFPVTYDLYRSTVSGADAWAQAVYQSGLTTLSYVDTAVTVNTTYYYGVKAKDSLGNTSTQPADTASAKVLPLAPCDTCHGDPPSDGSHMTHTGGTQVTYTMCDKCHGDATRKPSTDYTASGPVGLHNNGVHDVYLGRSLFSNRFTTSTPVWTAGTGICTNVDCHVATATPSWTGGQTNCDSCHGYPPTSAQPALTDHATTTGGGAVGSARLLSAHGDCNVCHGFSAKTAATPSSGAGTPVDKTAVGGDAYTQTSMHAGGTVQMNGYPGVVANVQNTGYNETTNSCDSAAACHPNTWKFSGTVRANTVELKRLGSAQCNTCHDAGTTVNGAAAPIVTSASTHTDADGAGAVYTAGDCTACHSVHATSTSTTGVNDVMITTQMAASRAGTTPTYAAGTVPTMNRAYATHGNKIRLGGNATAAYAKSTEAELCWACHDAQATQVTEWGTNAHTDTGTLSYNYGYLYTDTTGTTRTSNWTTGFWRSGKGTASTSPFWYKRAAIASVHTANFDTGTSAVTAGNTLGFNRTETKDTVEKIRCSYCHDVHGTHDGVNGDVSTAGGPYLRGTWKGNPYPEDGAPRNGWNDWTLERGTATSSVGYGRAPRGSASSTNTGSVAGGSNIGGWWIDQNSNNPNNGLTQATAVAATAGLCIQCHGSSVDTMDWLTGEGLWVSGGNGHQNAVLGGTGTTATANNIFNRTRRGSAAKETSGSNSKDYVDMGLATTGQSSGGYSYRSNSSGQGYLFYPRTGNTSSTNLTGVGNGAPYAYRYFPWSRMYNSTNARGTWHQPNAYGAGELEVGGMVSAAATSNTESATAVAQSQFHSFNCGKCHNPHASRLPKLMITNCLDTNHNDWDNTTGFSTSGTNTGIAAVWQNSRASQWPSAQNCHRVDDRGSLTTSPSTARGTGWNKATPWLEYSAP